MAGDTSLNNPNLRDLEDEVRRLRAEIAQLQATKATVLQTQLQSLEQLCDRLSQANLQTLEERHKTLQSSIDQLERRQERIQTEMRNSFAGVSQDIAIRVQGFKDYLVSSLQDLVVTAEQLNLPTSRPPALEPEPAPRRRSDPEPMPDRASGKPQFAQQSFQAETRQIQKLIEQFRSAPNYYGPPWQLRRTFEPIHAERVHDWFFKFGGRGALPALDSRLQNILVSSATISIMRNLYGERFRALILANSPERLGDWRRGLQDCLGVGRADFGPERGIVLFEAPESLSQKADRLLKEDCIPLILMDDSDDVVSLTILNFPFWLVFAPNPQARRDSRRFLEEDRTDSRFDKAPTFDW
jgi:hypothetical protein